MPASPLMASSPSPMGTAHTHIILRRLATMFPRPHALNPSALGPHPFSPALLPPWGARPQGGTSTAVAQASSTGNASQSFFTGRPSFQTVHAPLEPESEVAAAPQQPEGSGPRKPQTGAFQRLPMVAPSRELIDSALRRSERVGGNKKLKNEAARAKNRAARQLDFLMKELTGPLGTYERGFPRITKLHPFERALLELTVGPGTYERALARVTALRKASVEVAKGYAARASKAPNKKDAIDLQVEGFQRVEAVFGRGADAVDELKEVAKSLRRLPVVDPQLPTVALVGAPNVGKSSLVQLLSSGLPEVQNYPFTTRSIKMGHFYVDSRRHQVTDTPGLLNRPDEDRNAMERLTLASLQHLPTAVLFVADLTGECGTSVSDQWRIRADLRSKFPGKPWLDVLSKADLLEEEFDAADERQGAVDGSTEGSDVEDAVAFAAALPGAMRVSSLTGGGVDGLKAAMLTMLEEHELKSDGLEAWAAEQTEEDGEEGEAGGGVQAWE